MFKYIITIVALFFVACGESNFEVKTWQQGNGTNIEITATNPDGAEINEIIVNGVEAVKMHGLLQETMNIIMCIQKRLGKKF